ncbi:MAG: dihydrolipoamide acetyltransferase family protein, partial [Flavobacteriaceae bacterium]
LDQKSSTPSKNLSPKEPIKSIVAQDSVEVFKGEDEIIEMTRMGKLISKHMTNSVQTSAHVQSFIEVDVTKVWNWREKIKLKFHENFGEKITFTPIFMEAVAKALTIHPMLNISVDGDRIIKHKSINLGMATALADGNLIVPVIKNADQLNLMGMTKRVNDLAFRARNNQLSPDDIQDGTYTVTNVGGFGSIMGTPIINQPQVGILALGAIRKVPAVIETSEGDFIGIRKKMFLSHSYDHRVVNGALGGLFLKTVKELLESWDENRQV